jgi:hypothetical protein
LTRNSHLNFHNWFQTVNFRLSIFIAGYYIPRVKEKTIILGVVSRENWQRQGFAEDANKKRENVGIERIANQPMLTSSVGYTP